jgi:hypothetical protein
MARARWLGRCVCLLGLLAPAASSVVSISHQATLDDLRLLGWRAVTLGSLRAEWSKSLRMFRGAPAKVLFRHDAMTGDPYEARFVGRLPSPPATHLQYEVLHKIASHRTAYKATASAFDATLVAATPLVDDGKASLCGGAPALVQAGISKTIAKGCTLEGWWHFKRRQMRVAVERPVMGDQGSLSLEAVYALEEAAGSCELTFARRLAPGRSFRSTLTAFTDREKPKLDVAYMDRTLEGGRAATWVARASASVGSWPRCAVVRSWSF